MSGKEAYDKGAEAAAALKAGDKKRSTELRSEADLATLGAIPLVGETVRVARKTPEFFLRSVEAIRNLAKQKGKVPAEELFATLKREGVRGSEIFDTGLGDIPLKSEVDLRNPVHTSKEEQAITQEFESGRGEIIRAALKSPDKFREITGYTGDFNEAALARFVDELYYKEFGDFSVAPRTLESMVERNAPKLTVKEREGIVQPDVFGENASFKGTYYGNTQMPEYGKENRETLYYPQVHGDPATKIDYDAPHFGNEGEGLGFHTRTKVISDEKGDEGLMLGEIQGDAYAENRARARARQPGTREEAEYDVQGIPKDEPLDLPFGQEDWVRVATGQSIGQAYRDGLNHVYIPTVETAVKYHSMSPEKAKVIYERNALAAAKRFAGEYGAKLEQTSAGAKPAEIDSFADAFRSEMRERITDYTDQPTEALNAAAMLPDGLLEQIQTFLHQANDLTGDTERIARAQFARRVAPEIVDAARSNGLDIPEERAAQFVRLGIRAARTRSTRGSEALPGDAYWKLSFTPKTLDLIAKKGLPYYLTLGGLSAAGAAGGLGTPEAVAEEKKKQLQSNDPEDVLR